MKSENKTIFFFFFSGKEYLEFVRKQDEIYLEESCSSKSSNKIDRVFYFQMKPLEKDKTEFKIDYNDQDIKMLIKYGFR